MKLGSHSVDTDLIVQEIRKNKAQRVLIQLPDGLKQYAKEIVEALKKETDAEILIWMGSCYGGCDVPSNFGNIDIDLVIHLGHEPWEYKVRP